MNPKTLSPAALSVIDQYLHFRLGAAVCSIPYFNNKTVRARAALAVRVGKGSPHEMLDEIRTIAIKDHIAIDLLADEGLKKLLTDEGLGVDCSGFSWHVLNAENQERKKGLLSKHLHLIHSRGWLGKMLASLGSAKIVDVATFVDDRNSRLVPLKEAAPGDMITMMSSPVQGPTDSERNHILIVHETDRQDGRLLKINYSHAVAYPEDGLYGTGIKQGTIEIADPSGALTEGRWIENGKEGGDNRIFSRAQRSKTELRRLKWW